MVQTLATILMACKTKHCCCCLCLLEYFTLAMRMSESTACFELMYVSGPGIGSFKQVQKLPNVETWTEKHPIFGNFKVLPLLAISIIRCLMNAQHSISDSPMILPKLATPIIHSQHIQIWQNLCSVSIVFPITFHCGFWFPFLENCEFLPNVASILNKLKPSM